MHNYTNSQGELITVSTDHVDTAIEIYEELKKLSPSRRVNWRKHKDLMEQSGYDDSDVNESYRCFIKYYRKKNGTLPSVESYANMVAENRLEAIKNEVGALRLTKQEAQEDFRVLNKLVRETSRELIVVEEVKKAISELDWMNYDSLDFTPIYNDNRPKKIAVAFISDLHYGFDGNNDLTEYNPAIAKKLMKAYAEKLLDVCLKENVYDLTVVNLGDLVEGDLRNQSLFDAQKTLSTQAIEATNLVVEFLNILSQHLSVSYTGIAGNHDRLTRNPKEGVLGNHVMAFSNAIIENVALHTKNFQYFSPDNDYYTMLHINGVNVLAVHGDRTSMLKESVLAEQSVLFGMDIDVLVGGHFHNHRVKEVGNDKYVALFGSIKGSDDYSIQIGRTSSRSQGLMLFDDNGDFEIRQIKL